MGHKVHPFGFRLGYIRDWQTHWFADRPAVYRANLQEDIMIRDSILRRHRDAVDRPLQTKREAEEVDGDLEAQINERVSAFENEFDPEFLEAIVKAGGLIEVARKRAAEKEQAQ